MVSRDLTVGTVLSGAALRVVAWPAALVPGGAVHRPLDVIGHRLATPMRVGEAVTTTRLAGVDLTLGLPAGLVAVPVALSSPAGTALLHAGDLVDLLVSDIPVSDVSPSNVAADGSSPGSGTVEWSRRRCGC